MAPRADGRPVAALEVRGLNAGYGRVHVVHDVDLLVPAGSVVALLGANGAGKSTLLRTCAGLLAPWSGRVVVGGRPIRGLRPWKVRRLGVCYVAEGGGIFHDLTVRENLRLGAAEGLDDGSCERIWELFPVLADRQGQRAGSLSGGEKRMLALGRAVLARPRLLLLDEPSLGLAPVVVDLVFVALRRLRDEGLAMVVVEQYVHRALELADFAWVLAKGRVAHAGEAAALGGSPEMLSAYLGAAVGGGWHQVAPEGRTG